VLAYSCSGSLLLGGAVITDGSDLERRCKVIGPEGRLASHGDGLGAIAVPGPPFVPHSKGELLSLSKIAI
jgi:hypothetical protein